ncbi:MAG: DEAD/DEAH box helicase [Limnochordia bacterium]
MSHTTSVSTYRGYILDPFQIEAIQSIEEDVSVLVSAPTGTGKTLIADYLIERAFRSGNAVVYTAPIKALSNQKFKEFKRLLGEPHVGILTGDVVINPEASVLIMTTEILRNLLHQDPGRLDGVSHVIFDEIHYIDDPTRGSVWEESLIFMPPHMRFLGLSATIPNVDELARWISNVQGRIVKVIRHTERAVPLEHRLYESGQGFTTRQQLTRRYKRYARRLGVMDSGRIAGDFPSTTHLQLMDELTKEHLPCLFFAFSRRRCEEHAKQLAERFDYLDAEQKRRVKEVIEEQVARHAGTGVNRLRQLEPLLLRGIGFHHAGLLPVAKDIVEELFEQKLTYVLYCTETFAVGLNFPCKTVCFDSMTKWDGTEFRALSNREYFQIAGRAGRRGIDDKGYVFSLVDMNYFNPKEFPSMQEEDVEPLRSRFSLSYNTVLNLVRNYSETEIEEILQKNYASFQASEERQRLHEEIVALEGKREALMGCDLMNSRRCALLYKRNVQRLGSIERRIKDNQSRQRGTLKALRNSARVLRKELEQIDPKKCSPATMAACREALQEYRSVSSRLIGLRRRYKQVSPANAYVEEFRMKRSLLEALDYLREGQLTARGEFAAQINGHELLITELFFRGVFHDWDEHELNALCVSLDYEPRKSEGRARHRAFDEGTVRHAIHLIQSMEEVYLGYSEIRLNAHLADVTSRWSRGERFDELMKGLTVDEGDVVYAFRRAIDILRQVRNATREDTFLSAKMRLAIEKMDRDEVSVLL